MFIIAQVTPPKDDGSADFNYVLQVGKNIFLARHMNGYKIVVDKSTVQWEQEVGKRNYSERTR